MAIKEPFTLHIYYCATIYDIHALEALERHLSPLKQEGWLETWHEREILPGGNWEQERAVRLSRSQVVMALISPQILSDASCFQLIGQALARHQRGETLFLPILVQAMDWQNTPFRSLSWLPSSGVPVMNWPNPDEGFAQVAVEIRRVVGVLRTRLETLRQTMPSTELPGVAQPSVAAPFPGSFGQGQPGVAPFPFTPPSPAQPSVAAPFPGSFGQGQPGVVPFPSVPPGLAQPSVVAPFSGGFQATTARTNAEGIPDLVTPKNDPLERREPRSLRRRAVLLGLAGLGGVGALAVGGELFFRSHSVASLANQHPVQLLPLPITYRGHSNSVTNVAWSPDGKRLASTGADKTVQIWDLYSTKALFTYTGHTDTVLSVAWSPDGKRLASTGADKTIQIWDLHSTKALFTYSGHTDAVFSVAWSPDGTRLASAGADKTIQIWDLHSAQPLFTYAGHTDTVLSVVWSLDKKRLASAGADKTVQIWDLHSTKALYTYHGHSDIVTSVAWSPDGKRLASSSYDKTAQIWDTVSTKFTYHGHNGTLTSLTWSPDGKWLASASVDKTVQLWTLHSKTASYIYHGHSDVVTSLDWSPKGMLLASASQDKTVQVWNPNLK